MQYNYIRGIAGHGSDSNSVSITGDDIQFPLTANSDHDHRHHI